MAGERRGGAIWQTWEINRPTGRIPHELQVLLPDRQW